VSPEPLPPETKSARNERRKALAATFNALSVAIIVAALFQPFATGGNPSLGLIIVAMTVFIVLQNALHYILRRIED
jgi:hypothetical protein